MVFATKISSHLVHCRCGKAPDRELRKRETQRKRETDRNRTKLAATGPSLPAGFRAFAYFRAFAVPCRNAVSCFRSSLPEKADHISTIPAKTPAAPSGRGGDSRPGQRSRPGGRPSRHR